MLLSRTIRINLNETFIFVKSSGKINYKTCRGNKQKTIVFLRPGKDELFILKLTWNFYYQGLKKSRSKVQT